MKTKEELLQRKSEIGALLADETRSIENLSEIETELRGINEQLAAIEKREQLMKEANTINNGGAADVRTIETFNSNPQQTEQRENVESVNWEKRGQDLIENRAVTIASGDLVTPKHNSANIKNTFNQVSTLLDRVALVPLEGGESYESPYEISFGEGAYTAEGTAYFDVTSEFGYAPINKTKITAYSEVTEEVLKLPRANYAQRVFDNCYKALRKKVTKEILVGTGAAGQFTGIFSANATAINPATDIAISTIDNTTLDTIIYAYGGSEDVEDEAVLILSKSDLRKFALVRDAEGRKYYDIVNNGNTGTINGVQYIINSAAGSLDTAANGAYLMAYGPLSNYEVAVFSPTELRRSDDVKFKEGMVAHRCSVFAGGNVVAQNGFLRVKKAPAV